MSSIHVDVPFWSLQAWMIFTFAAFYQDTGTSLGYHSDLTLTFSFSSLQLQKTSSTFCFNPLTSEELTESDNYG